MWVHRAENIIDHDLLPVVGAVSCSRKPVSVGSYLSHDVPLSDSKLIVYCWL